MDERPNNFVWGYHGTTSSYVDLHLSQGIPISSFPGDWLGHGRYFWEGDLERAWAWAQDHAVSQYGGEPAVLAAIIDLSDCLDLTRTVHRDLIRELAEDFLPTISPEERASIKQTAGWHELDCRLIEYVLQSTFRSDGAPRFSTVRGAFQEGAPLVDAGAGVSTHIRNLDHIQINVVDPRAISLLTQVR